MPSNTFPNCLCAFGNTAQYLSLGAWRIPIFLCCREVPISPAELQLPEDKNTRAQAQYDIFEDSEGCKRTLFIIVAWHKQNLSQNFYTKGSAKGLFWNKNVNTSMVEHLCRAATLLLLSIPPESGKASHSGLALQGEFSGEGEGGHLWQELRQNLLLCNPTGRGTSKAEPQDKCSYLGKKNYSIKVFLNI